MQITGSRRLLAVIFLAGLYLSVTSCAPAPGVAPSAALQEQLQLLRQQQQQQEAQLKELQEQLASLQQNPQSPVPETPPTVTDFIPPQDPATVPGTDTSAAVPPMPAAEVSEMAASASTYLNAFSSLAMGEFTDAERGFERFLADYPDHQYAPNARFWLAGAQSALGKTNQAIGHLKQVIADPEGQEKAPAALVRLARIYRKAGLSYQADEAIEQLRASYPESSEAQQYFRSEDPVD